MVFLRYILQNYYGMSISSLVLLSLGRGLDNYFLVEAPVSVCKAIEIL